MNFKIFNKYKKAYYIEKEKHLYPFYCYKCLCFHVYSLKYNNYKAEIYPGFPYAKKSISLKIFLDYGLCLFANEIKCNYCEIKFISNKKIALIIARNVNLSYVLIV